MGGVVKSVGKLFGYDHNAISDASKAQADATRTAAERTAQANRETARAAQTAQETMLAQKKAADEAQELLNTPIQQADVTLGSESDDIDTTTGKRTKPRDQYSSSGLNI